MADQEQEHHRRTAEEMTQLILSDGRYPLDAFEFLHEGLEAAAKAVHGDKPMAPGQRHVTGAELCKALVDLAIQRWGPLARTVLRHWNITETIDFGNMVYLLVNNGFMQKTDEDSVEDFRDVYRLDEVLQVHPTFELKE